MLRQRGDPAKTVTSMFDKWPDFDEGEVGNPEQRALFGSPPPVIDSGDLLKSKRQTAGGMVAAFMPI